MNRALTAAGLLGCGGVAATLLHRGRQVGRLRQEAALNRPSITVTWLPVVGSTVNPSQVYVRARESDPDATRNLLAPIANAEHPEEVQVSRPSDALEAEAASGGPRGRGRRRARRAGDGRRLRRPGPPVVVPPVALAGGVGAALVIGAAAGPYPYQRAARLSPTEARAHGGQRRAVQGR